MFGDAAPIENAPIKTLKNTCRQKHQIDGIVSQLAETFIQQSDENTGFTETRLFFVSIAVNNESELVRFQIRVRSVGFACQG